MDKVSPHYKSKEVQKYFDNHNDTLIPAYLPTIASHTSMIMENERKLPN
jgi:hypothetical protein